MKKTCFLLLTVLLTTAALRASAQNKDTSKENFPSTETTLSQIGQAEAHPNARHVRMADTSALAAPVKRPGLIRRIIDYYSRSNVDRTFEKKIDWSIAPGPNYSSDVGFGIGFLLAGLYRLDRTDSVTAPSNISIYGNFTTEKFVLLRFSGDNIYNHNKQRLSYSGAFVYFPGAFYGVGYNAGKEGYAQDLTTTMGAFRISYCTSLVGRFYIGVSGGIDYSGAKYKNSGMADRMNGIQADVESGKPVPGGKMGELYNLWQEGRYDPAKQDPFSNYIATTGDKPNAFNANVGLFAQYDTRDVTFNASKGIFIKAEAKWYPEWLGNTRRTFGRFTLTFSGKGPCWPATSTPTPRPEPPRGTCTPKWAAWNACAVTTRDATATKNWWKRRSNCGRKSTAATASWDGSAAGRSGARRNSAGETRFAVSAAATASNSRTA